MSVKFFSLAMLFCFQIIIINCSPVFADERTAYEIRFDNINNEFDMCMDSSGGVTLRMLDCTSEAYTQFDALLNITYKVIMSNIKSDTNYADSLRKEQNAWLKLKEAASASAYENAGGGSASSLESSGVNFEMIKNRIQLFMYLVRASGG